jgi:hypothetical protein
VLLGKNTILFSSLIRVDKSGFLVEEKRVAILLVTFFLSVNEKFVKFILIEKIVSVGNLFFFYSNNDFQIWFVFALNTFLRRVISPLER